MALKAFEGARGTRDVTRLGAAERGRPSRRHSGSGSVPACASDRVTPSRTCRSTQGGPDGASGEARYIEQASSSEICLEGTLTVLAMTRTSPVGTTPNGKGPRPIPVQQLGNDSSIRVPGSWGVCSGACYWNLKPGMEPGAGQLGIPHRFLPPNLM